MSPSTLSSDAEKSPLLYNDLAADAESDLTLTELRDAAAKAQKDYMRAWSRSTNGRIPRILMLATSLLITFIFVGSAFMVAMDAMLEEDMLYHNKVAVEAHIMSKCPDARDCLREMILPVMVNVSEKIDFQLSFIGSSTDHDDGVLCKHGPQECLGNILELCASKLYPDPKIYLGFTMCLSKNFQEIAKQDLVEDCALEHGINFERLNNCATEDDGKHSVDMLQDSFARSAAANVSTSCTIRVNEQTFCIRDDGKWKNCPHGSKPQDLTDYINREYAVLHKD